MFCHTLLCFLCVHTQIHGQLRMHGQLWFSLVSPKQIHGELIKVPYELLPRFPY